MNERNVVKSADISPHDCFKKNLLVLSLFIENNIYEWTKYSSAKSKQILPNGKAQKDKQRSTKHTYKSKDRVTPTPLKTGGELRCSGRVSSTCSTSAEVLSLSLSLSLIKSIFLFTYDFSSVDQCVSEQNIL